MRNLKKKLNYSKSFPKKSDKEKKMSKKTTSSDKEHSEPDLDNGLDLPLKLIIPSHFTDPIIQAFNSQVMVTRGSAKKSNPFYFS